MKSSRGYPEYLRHILDELDFLINVSEDLTYEKLITDETIKRAVVRSIEIIGEASKKIPSEIKNRHKQIE